MKTIAAKLVGLAGLGILLLGLILSAIAVRMSQTLGDASWALGLTGAVMTILGAWLNKKGRQIALEPGEEFLARHEGPIITYLRSFGADRKADASRGGRVKMISALPESRLTEEEQIARAVAPIAPMVAIGRPGEILPQLGAYRVYTSDDEWQDKVHYMLARSELVIMRAGETDGFWWEVSNVFERIHPERIVFLLPKKRAEFEEFATRIQPFLPAPIPEYEPGGIRASFGGIMWFDEDFTPHITEAPYLWTAPFRHEVAASLRTVLRTAGKDFATNSMARASGKNRVLAALIDGAFVFASLGLGFALDTLVDTDGTLMMSVFGLAFLAYFLMESTPLRASPGKLFMGLEVHDETYLEPRTTQVAGRSLMRLMSMLTFWPALISLVLIFKDGRALHDMIVGTDVFNRDESASDDWIDTADAQAAPA